MNSGSTLAISAVTTYPRAPMNRTAVICSPLPSPPTAPIVRSAVRLCDGVFGAVFRFDGDLLYLAAHHNYTVEALEKVNGHLLNWYDTRTLEPLPPRYLSTVDSGNLAGALLTLADYYAWMPGHHSAESAFAKPRQCAPPSSDRPMRSELRPCLPCHLGGEADR